MPSDAAFREAVYRIAKITVPFLVTQDELEDALARVLALYAERPAEAVTEEMVRRFLSWPLPASVCADPCASMPNYPHRSGTNLLTYIEAKAMLEHVLAVHEPTTTVGQVCVVEEHRGESRIMLDGSYLPGDRVRVTRCEEGE